MLGANNSKAALVCVRTSVHLAEARMAGRPTSDPARPLLSPNTSPRGTRPFCHSRTHCPPCSTEWKKPQEDGVETKQAFCLPLCSGVWRCSLTEQVPNLGLAANPWQRCCRSHFPGGKWGFQELLWFVQGHAKPEQWSQGATQPSWTPEPSVQPKSSGERGGI